LLISDLTFNTNFYETSLGNVGWPIASFI